MGLAALIEHLDLTDVVLIGFSTGGGEVARFIGRHGTARVARAALVTAVPQFMMQADDNPDGVPIEVFDEIRGGSVADRSQLYRDLADGQAPRRWAATVHLGARGPPDAAEGGGRRLRTVVGVGPRPSVEPSVMAMRLTHIGGPTVLIEIAGWRLLTDPTFDAPGRRYAFGWGTSSRKLTGPAIAASDLGGIDAVLLSHDHHGDNLDDAGRALLPSAGTVVTTGPGAKRLGGGARGLEAWMTTRLQAPGRPMIEVIATPCRHGPPLSRPVAGAVIGFALRWEGQEHGVLWISGDTVLYDGVRQVAVRLEVGTALLHLGGVRFPVTGPVRYSMTARDALELCRLVRPRTAIPIHYEGWKHFRQGRDAIERELAAGPEDITRRIRWLPIGVGVELAG